MDNLIMSFVTIVCSVVASSGFWAFMQNRTNKHDAKTKMILGLGHDRLVYLCLSYINKGGLTKEEYENVYKYLYLPYQELGGNGTVGMLMEQLKKLPITGSVHYNSMAPEAKEDRT